MTRKKRRRKEERKLLKAAIPSKRRFSLLLTYANGNGTYTLVFRDFVNDLTLLLNEACPSGNCHCAGCRMVEARIYLYGRNNLDIKTINERTMALNLSDSETEWTSEFIETHQIDWEIWKEKLWIEERELERLLQKI